MFFHQYFPNGIIILPTEKKVKMTTVDFKLSLPDQLRKEAEAAGLLSPKAIERLLPCAVLVNFPFLKAPPCLRNWLRCLGGKNSPQDWNKPIQTSRNWFSVTV